MYLELCMTIEISFDICYYSTVSLCKMSGFFFFLSVHEVICLSNVSALCSPFFVLARGECCPMLQQGKEMCTWFLLLGRVMFRFELKVNFSRIVNY